MILKFNYYCSTCVAYCVVAVDSVGTQIPMALLERVKEDFNKRYGGGKADIAQANSLNEEFGPKLKEHMQYCMDHPDEISKLAKMKSQQSSEAKDALMKKIDEILSRGISCSFSCSSEPQVFIRYRRKKMWFQNMKMKLIVLAIIIALILFIILSVCGGFN
ncbi:Longin domain-containing protein [Hirschfeldia incana]|nr:Longin domain-containing protein [Hirschfeldia incana]